MTFRRACALAAAVGALAAAAVASAKPTEIYPLSKVRPGQKGYGLTTFQGTTPDRFEVEVLSVTKNWLPKMDLILFKSDDPKLVVPGIWKGMSGSPVYLDDKLACAVSYGFPFDKVTIGGCTPIETMMKDGFQAARHAEGGAPARSQRPRQTPANVGPAASWDEWLRIAPGNDPDAAMRSLGEPRTPWLSHVPRPALPRTAAAANGMAPAALPLAISGLTPDSFAMAAEWLSGFPVEPMQGAGTGGADEGPTTLQPGSHIGVVLARGDVSFAAYGTVTYVDGNRVLAFGHPMMEVGEFYAPIVAAKVHAVVPSAVSAFVLASPLRELGSLVQDRQSCIAGDTTLRTKMIPVDVYLEKGSGASLQKGEFHAEVLENKFLTAPLAGLITNSAVQSFLPDREDVTVYMESTVHLHGKKPLQFVDYLYAGDGASSVVSGARGLRVLVPLLFNPFSPVAIDRVEIRAKLTYETNFGEITELRLPRAELAPGERTYVDVVLTRYDESRVIDRVPFDVPASLAGEIVRIEVSAGDTARLDSAPPKNVDDLLAAFAQLLPGNVYAVTLQTADEGVAIRGKIVRDLPPSAIDRLYPAGSTPRAEPYKAIARSTHPANRVINGRQGVLVKIADRR